VTSDVLNDSKITRLIEEALVEDIGLGDITTEAIVPSDVLGRADILVKARGVIAGLEVAGLVFRHVDPAVSLTPLAKEGAEVESGSIVASIEGPLAGLLKAERTALNFLQRMSGIATLTHAFVKAVEGTRARITDTRKTVPGFRILDKLAVEVGGGVNHRFGLDDMVLIKDNHILAAGGISAAIEKCLRFLRASNLNIKVEVETRNFDEVREVLKHQGVHRIMLDNFPIPEMHRTIQLIDHTIETEASGNVSLENVLSIAETGVDYISIGRLTHSSKALDISLEVRVPISPPEP